jgi:hypothetical protein
MFGSSDVGAKRDVMGAVMFYAAQVIALAGISTVLVYVLGMAGVVKDGGNFFDGGHVHTLIGSVFTLWLGGSILAKRNATSDIMSVLVVAVGVYLAYTSNVMLGLVPIALLTTMSK